MGVPSGILWAKKYPTLLLKEKIIIPNQRQKPKNKTTLTWEVGAKIKGQTAKKLKKIITKKMEKIPKENLLVK